MTRTTLDDVLQECLTTDVTKEEPPSPVMWQLREFGDEAFETIHRKLKIGDVAGEASVRALRCLAYLAQDDVERVLRILSLAVELSRNEDAATRSEAVRSLVLGFRIVRSMLTRISDPALRERALSWNQVSDALKSALAAGVGQHETALAEEALREGR